MKKIIKNIFSLLVLACIGLAVFEILKLDVLPSKLFLLFIGLEVILFLIAFLFYNLKKKVLIVLGVILYILLIVGNALGYYYLSKINHYVTTSFKKDYYVNRITYYVITNKNNPVNRIEELDSNTTISYYRYSKAIEDALKKLGFYQYQGTDTTIAALTDLSSNNHYFLIAKANYDYLLINQENLKVLYEFEAEEKVEVNTSTPDAYNIYVNGLDFTGIMRDYNLIVTINTKTRKVVLTSIPRDYYIDVPAYNMKDTLMCLGSLDSEVSKEALEQLFQTKIDYTVNLNTNSLVGVVDGIGGVEFCSDTAFTTTHALVLDTYDDTTGKKLYVSKGCRTYNGIEILTIARERNAFVARDRTRQKNCRQILMNIVKKLVSTQTLTNYNEIIQSFDGLYTTDMNDKTIKAFIKLALEDSNFEIIEQSVDGSDSIGIGHLGTQEAWTITPDMGTVTTASNTINAVLNEK